MWVAANRSQHRPIRIAGSIEAPPRGREARGARPERCERLEYFDHSVKDGRFVFVPAVLQNHPGGMASGLGISGPIIAPQGGRLWGEATDAPGPTSWFT